MSAARLRIDYALRPAAGEDATAKAEGIAREQTVELDLALVSRSVREAVVGRVEAVEITGPRRARATLSFPLAAVGDDLPQLLNLLFGNISMQQGVRIEAVGWPEELLAGFVGPRFGIAGLRALSGVPARPLLCAALKPLGLSAQELAALAGRLARGGIDLIKDDHSLVDQPWAPFAERLERCQEAVERANAASGGRTLYLPNLTGNVERLDERAARARAAGCRAALVAPLLVGFDAVRGLAASSGLALLGHPSFTGGLLGRAHGIAPALLWGDLFRLAGCDGTIYPNAGGRFPYSLGECVAVAEHLRRPWGALAPAFPVLGGGMDAAKIRRWRRVYGEDTIFLLGGSLLGQADLEAGARTLRAQMEEAR
ncbi:MAG: ribulose 1,5-bisphosphate carboxylase [Holophagales bacterium]|nr:MAG: ribulose 1,5-bisphosphate carboxylase [Holophagales bacterium]